MACASGNLTRKDLNRGVYELASYDTRNRVTQILLKNSGNTTLQTQTWTYDDASNVATHTVSGVTTTYGYDDIDQLTSESRTGYSASYTYDANGNRATKTLGGTTQTYNYDDADKLTSITQGGNTVKSFSYDSAGRTTGITVSGNTTSFTYDFESRVTQITYPNQSTNSFTYNGLDTRVGKTDSGGSKTFLRDGAGVTAPVINDSAASYTPGISERRSSASAFYHGGIKNAESQTASNESVSATVKYDAFGLLVDSSGTFKGPFGYGGPYGYQEDGDSGLTLLGHRYYDSSTGRFLTRDPIKDGRNWYVYCQSNPIKFCDPDGLVIPFVVLVVAAAMMLTSGTAEAPTVGGPSSTAESRASSKLEAAADTVLAILLWPQTLAEGALGVVSRGGGTEPKHPPKVVVKADGVSIEVYKDDHGPPHAHVKGGGPETKIGQNSKPIKGSPEPTVRQRGVIDANKGLIRKAIDKAMKLFRWRRGGF